MSEDALEEPDFETEPTLLKDSKVTIVGLGLMGGSLALALKKRQLCRLVCGVARRQATIEEALARSAIDVGTSSLQEGIAEADLVVLALPVRTIIEFLPQVGRLAKPGCLVMDVGSTKHLITQAMADLPKHIQVLGAHPMCGKETSGLAVAEATLYENAIFALTPLPRTKAHSLQIGQTLIRGIGATPLVLDPSAHDRLVAAISHLPYLLACSLVATAQEIAAEDPRVWDLAASGFRDTSRLAASHVGMMLDILMTNRQAVTEMIDLAKAQLTAFERWLETGDQDTLADQLAKLQQRRSKMFTGEEE